ncbi:TPA: hypothetical protein ACN976_005289, partial [Vibrio campbellii]
KLDNAFKLFEINHHSNNESVHFRHTLLAHRFLKTTQDFDASLFLFDVFLQVIVVTLRKNS